MATFKAARCASVREVAVVEMDMPQVSEDEILVKVSMCGVCGSDMKKLEGQGLRPPQTLGHEVVGTVFRAGKHISHLREGERVVVSHHVPCFQCHYCRHQNFSMCRAFKTSNLDPGGFAQYVRVPNPHVRHALFRLPEGMREERAMWTEPLACCLRCVERIGILPGDHVTLVGFGSIGFLFCALLQSMQVRVSVLDTDENRLSLAKSKGAHGIHPLSESVKDEILEATEGRGSDVVLFTAGTALMLRDSFAWVRDGGTLCLFAELKDEEGLVSFKEIYKREIRLLSSYSPSPNDLKGAFERLCSESLDLSHLECRDFSLAEIPQAMQMTRERKIMKAVIRPFREP